METNENFFVEYFDGNKWIIIGNYISGKDFTNNSFYFEEGIMVNKSSSVAFPKNMKIRFRCDASSNGDAVFIDEIKITAQK